MKFGPFRYLLLTCLGSLPAHASLSPNFCQNFEHFAKREVVADDPQSAIQFLKDAQKAGVTDPAIPEILRHLRKDFTRLWARNTKNLPVSNAELNSQVRTLVELYDKNRSQFSIWRMMAVLKNFHIPPESLLSYFNDSKFSPSTDEDYRVFISQLKKLECNDFQIGQLAHQSAFTQAKEFSQDRQAIFDAWLASVSKAKVPSDIRAGWLMNSFNSRLAKYLPLPPNLHTVDLIHALNTEMNVGDISKVVTRIKELKNWQEGDLEKILLRLCEVKMNDLIGELADSFSLEFNRIPKNNRLNFLSQSNSFNNFKDEAAIEKIKEKFKLTDEDFQETIRLRFFSQLKRPQETHDLFSQPLLRPYLLNFSPREIVDYLRTVTHLPDLFKGKDSLWAHYGFNNPQNAELAASVFTGKQPNPLIRKYNEILADELHLSELIRRKILFKRLDTDTKDNKANLAILLKVETAPDPIPAAALKKVFSEAEAEGVLPARTVEIIFNGGRIQDGNVNFALYLDLMKYRETFHRDPKNTLSLMAWKFGFDETSLLNCKAFDQSQSFTKDFYVILSELSSTLGSSPFTNKTMPVLNTSKSAETFISGLELMKSYCTNYFNRYYFGKNLNQLSEADRNKLLDETVHSWHIDKDSSTEAIQKQADFYREKNFSIFSELLTQSGSTLTSAQLKTLETEWGDLSPLLILANRLNSPAALKEIGQIFEASLQGKFSDYKFNGHAADAAEANKAQEQMQALTTPEHKAAWIKDYATLKVVSPKDFNLAEVLTTEGRNFTTHVTSSLFPNLAHDGIAAVQVPENTKMLVLDTLLNRRDNPTTVLNELRAAIGGTPQEADAQILWSVLEEFKLPYDSEKSAALASRLNAMMARDDGAFFVGKAQLKSDLKTIMELPKARVMGAQKESIVLTLTTSHPKLLLMTGDLVDCASCQNYRTGSVVRTVLGYVKDANAKLILSQNISPGDLAPQDYAALKKAVEAGRAIEAHIDPRDLSILIQYTAENGQPVSLKTPPRKFYRRHVLKLGTTTSGDVGLFMERAYTQVLPAQEAMESEALRMLHNIARETGARTGEALTIRGSRAPFGQYSDAGGGVQEGNYMIPAAPQQK